MELDEHRASLPGLKHKYVVKDDEDKATSHNFNDHYDEWKHVFVEHFEFDKVKKITGGLNATKGHISIRLNVVYWAQKRDDEKETSYRFSDQLEMALWYKAAWGSWKVSKSWKYLNKKHPLDIVEIALGLAEKIPAPTNMSKPVGYGFIKEMFYVNDNGWAGLRGGIWYAKVIKPVTIGDDGTMEFVEAGAKGKLFFLLRLHVGAGTTAFIASDGDTVYPARRIAKKFKTGNIRGMIEGKDFVYRYKTSKSPKLSGSTDVSKLPLGSRGIIRLAIKKFLGGRIQRPDLWEPGGPELPKG